MHFRGETPAPTGSTGPSHAYQSRFHVASRGDGKKRWLGEISTEPKIDDGIRERAFFQPPPKKLDRGCLSNTNTATWERSDDPCGEVGNRI